MDTKELDGGDNNKFRIVEQLIDCFDIEKIRKKAQNEKKRTKKETGPAERQAPCSITQPSLLVQEQNGRKTVEERYNPAKRGWGG